MKTIRNELHEFLSVEQFSHKREIIQEEESIKSKQIIMLGPNSFQLSVTKNPKPKL